MMGLTTHARLRPCVRTAAIRAVLTLAVLLGGCGANMRAAVGTAAQALDGGAAGVDTPQALDPRLHYLRVQVGRQVGLMVRADAGRAPAEPVTYWYSADGALLRLRDGLLVGLTESSRSWRVARGPEAVDWLAVAQGRPFDYRRIVDQQPGYRIGLRETRRIQAQPSAPAGHQLRQAGARLQWFVERDPSAETDLATWYAVDLAVEPPRVVYGQACLAADWCINWQPWPPRAGSS
jgi:hypothetical protein